MATSEQKHTTGVITRSFNIADFLTSSLVMATSEQKHTATRFSKRLCRNSGFKLGSHLCSNLGDGDVEIRNCDRSIRKYAILLHLHTRDKTISNTKKKQIFGERKCHNQILSPVIIYPLLNNNKRDTVVKQDPLSERPSSTQPHKSQLHVLPDIKEDGDSIEGDKMSIAEGLDSDLYRFKPTDTAIDDIYLERIRHIWLKSGLPHKPAPVLEKLEVEPDARETEIIEISHVDPKTSSKLYISPFLEHLDDAFIDWVLGLGIPLAKISPQEVQTSHENLRKLKLFKSAPKAPIEQDCSCDLPTNLSDKLFKSAPKAPIEQDCSCDLPTNLSDILRAPQSNINVNQKRTVPANIGYSTFQKKRYSQPPQLVSSKESIQKEILDILNSIINKLDHKVQKQLLTLPASREPKRKKQKILLPSSNVHNDYCGLKYYPDDNHVCRVKIDKKHISKRNPKFEDGIKEELYQVEVHL
ncbi:hypothetical protein QE152_g7373 [Popillia japonica]|uniref:Uncharacterized protein n=1 Tax=Popillia japonica TaxID=7064 RepID=A0AAW1MEZ0_POPJA